MSTATERKQDNKQIDQLIDRAIKKVGVKKENDICRYIPGPKGGYIHHFSMRKMKHEDPDGLTQLINKFILNLDQPHKQPPKARAPRGSRKRKDHLPLSKQDIDMIISLARKSGEKDLVRKLAPKRDLKTLKRELISSIKNNRVDEDLWQSYAEVAQSNNNPQA
jgi:hypothetical protein